MSTADRFRGGGESVYAFSDRVWVRCPSCDAAALVAARAEEATLTCTSCGVSKRTPVTQSVWGIPEDPYFGLPLMLQTPCCGEVLWARNREHVDYLTDLVAAKLRERDRHDSVSRNSLMSSRLPRWLTRASNRDEVLKALVVLAEKAKAFDGRAL